MIEPSCFSQNMEEKAEQSLLDFQEAKGDLNLALDAIMAQDIARLTTRYEQEAKAMDSALTGGSEEPGDPMGDVRIRSPQITHHHHHAATPKASTLAKAALAFALVGAGGASGALTTYLLTKPTTPNITNIDGGYKIELLEPKGKQ